MGPLEGSPKLVMTHTLTFWMKVIINDTIVEVVFGVEDDVVEEEGVSDGDKT